jgi:hypothetical protein
VWGEGGGGRYAGPLLPAAMGSIPWSQQAIYLIGPGIQRMSEFQHLEEAGNLMCIQQQGVHIFV